MEGLSGALAERLVAAEERVADALERLVSLSANLVADSVGLVAGSRNRESPKEKAMRLLVEFGPDNVTAIAKAVGVNRSTLYRWAGFKEAMERLRAAEQWSHRNPRAVRHDEL